MIQPAHLDLEHSIEPSLVALLRRLGQLAAELDFPSYVVGGFVRDRIATQLLPGAFDDIDGLDIDIVLEGQAICFGRFVQQLYGGDLTTHERFGTAKWRLGSQSQPLETSPVLWDRLLADLALNTDVGLPTIVDFVTARRETYAHAASLPETEPSDLDDDLKRRDLSINTLAVSLHPDNWGQLVDQHNGAVDLRAGAIRVLHDASFIDDPTRIFRTIRYAQRFGFDIEPRTLTLLIDALPLLNMLTPVRVQHEFDRIFDERKPFAVLQQLAELGVLGAVHPALHVNSATVARFSQYEQSASKSGLGSKAKRITQRSDYWALLLIDTAHTSLSSIFERLALSKDTQKQLLEYRELQAGIEALEVSTLPPSQVAKILDRYGRKTIELAARCHVDNSRSMGESTVDSMALDQTSLNLQRYLSEWIAIKPKLNGHDLANLGMARGPQFRAVLTALRAKVLDGELTSREDEIEYVQSTFVG